MSSDSICLLREKLQNALDALLQRAVDHREISREGKHGDNHHHGRALHLLTVRPSHAPHLELQFVKVVPRAVDPLHYFVHKPSLTPYSQLLCEAVGRGGGIRTPTRGFGDRWSTVKPTPLGGASVAGSCLYST